MENSLELKTVNELCVFQFYIPSYQRGYRWKQYEVIDLLNDIYEFSPKEISNSDEKTWYCLQPIVTKAIGDKFEVIDGQQRLTTIYLILHYLNQDFIESRRLKLFTIEYETRAKSQEFLMDIKHELKDSNIDFYYISQAYKTISVWFEEKEKNPNFDKGNFISKFRFNTRIIWYQSFEENPINIFTRINVGKIPLTNAELIKALFLNGSNLGSNGLEKLRQRQFEIANEWDQIEHSLQDDKLWYFVSKSRTATNRIEFIFDLMNKDMDQSDAYSTFRFFANEFKSNEDALEEIWAKIKQIYQRFKEWFSERELYHKIGFLLYIESVDINTLLKQSEESSKMNFNDYLDGLIKNSLKDIDLNELQYEDKFEVKKVLLLYNILTMLNSTKDNSYFPFDIFKNENWDIEHITSVKDKIPDNKDRHKWLQEAKVFIDPVEEGSALLERANSCDCSNEELFKLLFEDMVTYFNSKVLDGDVNDISNLTLLDSETNRGYKNAVFPLKRKTIIDRDKQGVFIPLCTKNVFLKYFNEYPPKISFWTQEDKDSYLNDLTNTLSKYLNY